MVKKKNRDFDSPSISAPLFTDREMPCLRTRKAVCSWTVHTHMLHMFMLRPLIGFALTDCIEPLPRSSSLVWINITCYIVQALEHSNIRRGTTCLECMCMSYFVLRNRGREKKFEHRETAITVLAKTETKLKWES